MIQRQRWNQGVRGVVCTLYMMKSRGPSTEPWGTPHEQVWGEDMWLSHLWHLLITYTDEGGIWLRCRNIVTSSDYSVNVKQTGKTTEQLRHASQPAVWEQLGRTLCVKTFLTDSLTNTLRHLMSSPAVSHAMAGTWPPSFSTEPLASLLTLMSAVSGLH